VILRRRGQYAHHDVVGVGGGTVPFGWKVGDDGALIEVPEQQAVIQEIIELRRRGISLRAIAAKVSVVSHVTVRSILANADIGTGRAQQGHGA